MKLLKDANNSADHAALDALVFAELTTKISDVGTILFCGAPIVDFGCYFITGQHMPKLAGLDDGENMLMLDAICLCCAGGIYLLNNQIKTLISKVEKYMGAKYHKKYQAI